MKGKKFLTFHRFGQETGRVGCSEDGEEIGLDGRYKLLCSERLRLESYKETKL